MKMPFSRVLILILAVGFCACAAPAYRPGLRSNVPSTRNYEENRVTSWDGTKLLLRRWFPSHPPRATLVIVHGLKDYGDRYSSLARNLVAQGMEVYSFDLRGHGDSEGDRVWINSFDDYLNDLDTILKIIHKSPPAEKVFLLGHSMGGTIVTLSALKRHPQISGLILSAPALKITEDVSKIKIFATNVFGGLIPRLAVFTLDDERFSRDASVVASMRTDPLIFDTAAPARTAKELLASIEEIQGTMKNLDYPFLVLHGTEDRITNPEGSKQLQASAKAADKTTKLYPGLYHDLLHEPEKNVVIKDISDWISGHSP